MMLSDRAACLRPAVWEVASLAGLLVYCIVSGALFGPDAHAVVNWTAPVALTAILCGGAYRMVRMEPQAIWTSLFALRVATAIYFGVGTLAPFLVGGEMRIYMEGFFRFNEDNIYKLNILIAASVFAVVAASYATDYLRPFRPDLLQFRDADDEPAIKVGLVFLLVGMAFKYLIAVPHVLGWQSGTVPGALLTISMFQLVGLYIVTAWTTRHREFIPYVLMLAVFELGIGLILLSKTEVMMTLIVLALGLISQRPSIPKMLGAMAVIASVFVIIQPVVSYGRENARIRYGGEQVVKLSDRLGLIAEYFGPDVKPLDRATKDQALARISYVNQASFAMSAHDRGVQSNSLTSFFAVVIPRFLWPNKPNITQFGLDFVTMATGQRTGSSASPGLFAEAYWDFGWMGVLYMVAPLGVLFTLLSRYSLNVLWRRDWFFLPVVLFALRMGTRIDGNYVGDVPGALVMLLALHWLLQMAATQFPEFRPQASPDRMPLPDATAGVA